MKKYLVVAVCLVAAVASVVANVARAENWPARPVKMIVGFAPGGPTDLVARLLAQSLSATDRQKLLRRERLRRRRQYRRRSGGAVGAGWLYGSGHGRQPHQ